jgi:hypothetical protein
LTKSRRACRSERVFAKAADTALIGGDDPMAAMSLSHRGITHLSRLLQRVSRDLGPEGPDSKTLAEILRLPARCHSECCTLRRRTKSITVSRKRHKLWCCTATRPRDANSIKSCRAAMPHLRPHKSGLVLGSVVGGWHLAWAIIVAIGWGQPLIDLVFWMHFLRPVLVVEPFAIGRAIVLVLITATIGYFLCRRRPVEPAAHSLSRSRGRSRAT